MLPYEETAWRAPQRQKQDQTVGSQSQPGHRGHRVRRARSLGQTRSKKSLQGVKWSLCTPDRYKPTHKPKKAFAYLENLRKKRIILRVQRRVLLPQTPARTHGPGQPQWGLQSEIERPPISNTAGPTDESSINICRHVWGWGWGTLFGQLFDIISQK